MAIAPGTMGMCLLCVFSATEREMVPKPSSRLPSAVKSSLVLFLWVRTPRGRQGKTRTRRLRKAGRQAQMMETLISMMDQMAMSSLT